MLYSVPPADRRRAFWVMSREWRDKLIEYAEVALCEQPPLFPSALLGVPFVVDDAYGFPALAVSLRAGSRPGHRRGTGALPGAGLTRRDTGR